MSETLPAVLTVAVFFGLILWLGIEAIRYERRKAKSVEDIAFGEASTYRRFKETK